MIKRYFKKQIAFLDATLEKTLHAAHTYPALIHDSMRYMTLSGGKRIRPILAIACCEACGGLRNAVTIPAMAIELVHTYSLVHDDLPCMDNDDERRGNPTCHVKYGEAYAVLTGDALLTYAFELLTTLPPTQRTMRIIKELSSAAGTLGMIGGQVVDKLSENEDISLPLLDYINVHKTGKLIAASCRIGALSADATRIQEKAIVQYGKYLGFAFQIVDDIIDGDGYMRFMSRHEAFKRAEELTENAKHAVKQFGKNTRILDAVADFVLNRGKVIHGKKKRKK